MPTSDTLAQPKLLRVSLETSSVSCIARRTTQEYLSDHPIFAQLESSLCLPKRSTVTWATLSELSSSEPPDSLISDHLLPTALRPSLHASLSSLAFARSSCCSTARSSVPGPRLPLRSSSRPNWMRRLGLSDSLWQEGKLRRNSLRMVSRGRRSRPYPGWQSRRGSHLRAKSYEMS
jgi:hypothetical protein